MNEYTVEIKSLTPIWTGGEDRKNTSLRETGIIGSLRWWYEALIRGLGGTACDPTETKCNKKNHCDACELFGCTGWARKFRLEVVECSNTNKVLFRFIELRKIEDIEWALLNEVLSIISKYGAVGGKLASRECGLIEITVNDLSKFTLGKNIVSNYLKGKGSTIETPDLRRFVFIESCDLSEEFVKEIKVKLPFLKGKKDKGKRYFYKTIDKRSNRFFAYAKSNDEYNEMIKFLNNKSLKFIEGKQILEGLK